MRVATHGQSIHSGQVTVGQQESQAGQVCVDEPPPLPEEPLVEAGGGGGGGVDATQQCGHDV